MLYGMYDFNVQLSKNGRESGRLSNNVTHLDGLFYLPF